MNAEVMGISPDSISSHQKFKKKYALTYPLLVDEDHRLADEYGIWKEKSMYGVKYWGVERTTVIIGRDGRIAKIFPKVKIPGHVQEVERAVQALA
jgi:thioredoxin-dependent peroxiredoxin